MSKERKSLELTPQHFARLDELAAEFELTPGVGPTPNRPSWRILVRKIATGDIVIISTTPKETDNE